MLQSHTRGCAVRWGAGPAARRRTACLLVVTCFGLGACAVTPTPPPRDEDHATYRVGAPDQLLVSILPEPVIERTVVVRPDGRISVDLIGDVPASGRTVEEIGQEIQERIGRFKRDAVVTVSLVASRSSTVTIFGQVLRPGLVTLDRETRLADAVGSVGGVTIFASKGRVRVIRADLESTEILAVNLRDIEQGDLGTNFMLHDGDIVVVPPNALARIGFALQTILFPFQQILSAGTGALLVSQRF